MPHPIYDAVVVGTGPGGATVAREMALRKKTRPHAGKGAWRSRPGRSVPIP